MSAVSITGCSGAGKTTIAAVLARRGLAAIDADDDPLLARSVDAAGNVVEEEPAAPDFAWLARHSWAWNPARLDELIRAAAPTALYVCGGAANELELADRFTQVFLLEIDEPTMLARIDARQDNDWGRIGDTREYLRRFLPGARPHLAAVAGIVHHEDLWQLCRDELTGVDVCIDGWDIRGRWFGVVVGATPRTGELRRGQTIPWRVIAAQIAPGERRGPR